VTRARERLRFPPHRRGLRDRAEAAFAPVPGKGAVLFRRADGACFCEPTTGVLAPISYGRGTQRDRRDHRRYRVAELEAVSRASDDGF